MEQRETTAEYRDLRFRIFPDHAEVTGAGADLFTAEIPEEVEGVPVTAVAAHAFENSPVPEFVLPDSLKSIGAYAFANCDALQEIALPKDVEKIGPYAFYHCRGLREVSLHDGLRETDNAAFLSSDGISEITLYADRGCYGCLKPILSELYQEVRVVFTDAEGSFAIVFPEYFIEYTELPEARIFDEDTLGSGRVYRKFFSGDQFDITSYDRHFSIACLKDEPAQAARVAMARLLTPRGLIDSAKTRYEDWLRAHVDEGCLAFAREGDEKALDYLLRAGILTREHLPAFLEAARRSRRVQTVVRLMQASREMA